MRRLRTKLQRNRRSDSGVTALGFGVRIGYWPCLKAPYVQFAVAFWRLDVWHGLPSYRSPD